MAKKKELFKLEFEEKRYLKRSIATFFEEEFELEMGEIATSNILDFCLEVFGVKYYNEGVKDAQKFISEKLLDLYEIEKSPK